MLIQSPNLFGTLEDVAAMTKIAHKKGALLAVAISEAVSLGIVRPPAEATSCMEAQSFGVPLGRRPYAGVIATKEKFVRQMPGRLVARPSTSNGNRGFVLTLSTREQHIRREKATSNICTNQALIALMATVFMTVTAAKASANSPSRIWPRPLTPPKHSDAGKVLFSGAPRFNEFVVQTKDDSRAINKRLLDRKIVGGFPLKKFYPELGNASLWCVTEVNPRAASTPPPRRWRNERPRIRRPPRTSTRTKA